MNVAAAEAARAVATDYDGDLSDVREFVPRRLEAVPDLPLFHAGGRDDWQIELSESGGRSTVSITGHARPLPLMGVIASAFGLSDGQGVVLRVEVEERLRPEWVSGGYQDWQTVWG